jgi:hypothetical protein
MMPSPEDWADVLLAAAEAGFGLDSPPALVIRTLAAANAEHETEILHLEAALGGCRPALVPGRVRNILVYIERLKRGLPT